MFEIVKASIQKSIDAILEHYSAIDEIRENENEVNLINKGISRNLSLLMASNINMHESKLAATLFSINVDLERMSDHAMNIAEAGEDLVRSDLSFSVDAYDEIHELSQLLLDSLVMIDHIIKTGEHNVMERIDANEEKIDDLCFRYRDIEIERMKKDTDESESGVVYTAMLIDIERIGDHIVNIAESLCNSLQDQ